MAHECPSPKKDCRYYGTDECILTRHHELWPRRNYRSRLEKAARTASVVILSRCLHDELHATTEAPAKPSVEQMRGLLEAKTMSDFYQRQVDRLDTELLELRYQIEDLLNQEDGLVKERERWAGYLVTRPTLTLIQGGLDA